MKFPRRIALLWRNERDSVSNHRRLFCLLNHLFRRRSKKTSKLRVTGLWAGNWPVIGEFPAQRAKNAENVSIWWRNHPGDDVKISFKQDNITLPWYVSAFIIYRNKLTLHVWTKVYVISNLMCICSNRVSFNQLFANPKALQELPSMHYSQYDQNE